MAARSPTSPVAPRGGCAWPLEVDAELADPAPRRVTDAMLHRLAGRLNATAWVHSATAQVGSWADLVRVSLTVDADDLGTAAETACELVRACAGEAGLGSVILVAIRVTPGPLTHRG